VETLKAIVVRYFSTLLTLVTIVGLVIFCVDLYRSEHEAESRYQELLGTKEKYEQLSQYTAKLEVEYKNQKDLSKLLEETWQDISRRQEEKIKLLSDATYLIGKHSTKQDGPDYYFQTPKGTQNLIVDEIRIAGPDSPPVGFILIKSDGTTYKANYKFEIRAETLQTKDDDSGKVTVYSKAYFVAGENGLAEKRRPDLKKWKDVPYPLQIVGGSAVVDPTEQADSRSLRLWAPRLVGGVNGTAGAGGLAMRPSLGVSLAGFGYSRRDLDWRFVQLGVDAKSDLSDFGVNVVPLSWRPFRNTLVNTYLGPGIGWTVAGPNLFMNLSLGF
jgi:hypothetical protein